MRKETVDAWTAATARKLCPWAAVVVRVDGGNGRVAYTCFESVEDARIARAQR